MIVGTASSAFILLPAAPGTPYWERLTPTHLFIPITAFGLGSGALRLMRGGARLRAHSRPFSAFFSWRARCCGRASLYAGADDASSCIRRLKAPRLTPHRPADTQSFMPSIRSLLFVPGSRPDRFAKAVASGADAVCIDLEDAVPQQDKNAARQATLEFLAVSPTTCAAGFRINALSTIDAFRDVVAYDQSAAKPAFLMVPKAMSGRELHQLRSALGDRCPPLWPLIEGPGALSALPDIAAAASPDGGVMLGGVDYAAAIGADPGWDTLYHIRASIVAATSAAGCGAIDAPYLDTADVAGLEAETRRVRAMGFGGRACIHPGQVETINRSFEPTAAEVSKAKKIAAAFAAADGGVVLLEGKLVEKPVHDAAARILAAQRT